MGCLPGFHTAKWKRPKKASHGAVPQSSSHRAPGNRDGGHAWSAWSAWPPPACLLLRRPGPGSPLAPAPPWPVLNQGPHGGGAGAAGSPRPALQEPGSKWTATGDGEHRDAVHRPSPQLSLARGGTHDAALQGSLSREAMWTKRREEGAWFLKGSRALGSQPGRMGPRAALNFWSLKCPHLQNGPDDGPAF